MVNWAAMKYRTVKITPEGKLPRERVRDVVRGVHVVRLSPESWQVRTLGTKPISKTFGEKGEALAFADDLGRKRQSKIVIHRRTPRPAAVRNPSNR